MKTTTLDQVMKISTDNLWFFQPLGKAGTLTEPYYKDNFWLYPMTEDSTLPDQALARVRAVTSAVPVVQVVIGHEHPPLLPAGNIPKPEAKPAPKPAKEPAADTEKVSGGLATVAEVILKLIFGIVGAMIMVDPVVICVLEDGTWVKVYSWVD